MLELPLQDTRVQVDDHLFRVFVVVSFKFRAGVMLRIPYQVASLAIALALRLIES